MQRQREEVIEGCLDLGFGVGSGLVLVLLLYGGVFGCRFMLSLFCVWIRISLFVRDFSLDFYIYIYIYWLSKRIFVQARKPRTFHFSSK